MMMPSCSSEMPSSFSEHTIEDDSTPRILDFLSVMMTRPSLCPSYKRAPSSASTTFCPLSPTLMFGAPVIHAHNCETVRVRVRERFDQLRDKNFVAGPRQPLTPNPSPNRRGRGADVFDVFDF